MKPMHSRRFFFLFQKCTHSLMLSLHGQLIGTFRPERIKQIAIRFGVDPDAALENIIMARAYNSEHQMDLITQGKIFCFCYF